MNKHAEEKLFGNVSVNRKSMELLSKLDAYMGVYFDDLTDKFVSCFEQFAGKVISMQQAGEKEEIAFINFSVLRTNILVKKHCLRIDAYNPKWYLDRTECSGEYEVGEIYRWLEQFESVLESVRKKSVGQLKLSEVQELVFEESRNYLVFVTELIRAGMKKAAETAAYKDMRRHEIFTVCVGEFQDAVSIVYKEDREVKSAEEVKRRLQDRRQEVYNYEICRNLDLSNGNYEDKGLMFASFTGSDFTGSSFKNSLILFSEFHNAVLKNTNLENIQIIDTDFNGAVLENVNFKGAKLKRVSFKEATLIHVDFRDAILLEDLNFENVKLKDSKLPDGQAGSR